MNALLDRVDVDRLLDHVDVNRLLDHVNVNALLDRVDVDSLLGRLDVNSLLDRVDVNDLVGRMDMDALVQDTDLGAIMARSTGGVASDVLDAARSQAVELDQLVDRWVRRILRRKQPGPAAPPATLLPAQPAVTPAQAAP